MDNNIGEGRMIKVDNLSKSFVRKNVLKDVSFRFSDQCYGLLGPNGAGKTTFIRCMLGLYQTKRSKIEFSTEGCVGYLPQKFGVFPELCVKDVLMYFALSKGIPKKKCKAEISKVLSLVNLESEYKTRVSRLSGGMLRRVGIAQVLLADPDIMIFDEPTVGLDPEERMRFGKLINDIKPGKTIIVSTHIIEDVEKYCDLIVVMNSGEIVGEFPVEKFREKDATGNLGIIENYLDIIHTEGSND